MNGLSSAPVRPDAPVLAAVIGPASADAVLRRAFAEADGQGVAVQVVGVGRAGAVDDDLLFDQVHRWAEKYPHVPVNVSLRRQLDAAITLGAVSGGARALVVELTGSPMVRSVVAALRRRAHCPVVVLGDQ
jgi:hypothetical protein